MAWAVSVRRNSPALMRRSSTPAGQSAASSAPKISYRHSLAGRGYVRAGRFPSWRGAIVFGWFPGFDAGVGQQLADDEVAPIVFERTRVRPVDVEAAGAGFSRRGVVDECHLDADLSDRHLRQLYGLRHLAQQIVNRLPVVTRIGFQNDALALSADLDPELLYSHVGDARPRLVDKLELARAQRVKVVDALVFLVWPQFLF